MPTYKESGVDIEKGDLCSKIAYDAAKETFINRKGLVGEPVLLEGGFSGALNMGDFYLVQNDDGVGTKAQVANLMKKYDTLGFDLVAMVTDDGICLGAEMISVSNTIDINKVDDAVIKPLMKGLKDAAKIANVVIPGGEIAELGDQVNGFTWNATGIGIVKKDRLITGEDIKEGDSIIGLQSKGFRSNGFSLIRKILSDSYGENWYQESFNDSLTWGDVVLTPSKIYCHILGKVIGTFSKTPLVKINALAHITGGGLPGNISRITSNKGLGVKLENLFPPHDAMLKLQELGKVDDMEAYRTWNMGVGMVLVTREPKKVMKLLTERNVAAQIIGEVTSGTGISLKSLGHFSGGEVLKY